jgi:hypothetical protein
MLQPDSGQNIDGEYLDAHHRICKSDYIRLLQQALSELGLCAISDRVAAATGIACEDAHIVSLREQIARGEWLDACQSIQECSGVPSSAKRRVQFVLLREHVLEVGPSLLPLLNLHWAAHCPVSRCSHLYCDLHSAAHGLAMRCSHFC